MKSIPSAIEISPSNGEFIEEINSLELFLNKHVDQAYVDLVKNSDDIGFHEALYYMGPLARPYYLPILERYLNEFYLVEDFSIVHRIISDCEAIMLSSESDYLEKLSYPILYRCVLFIIDNFKTFQKNDDFESKEEIDKIWFNLLKIQTKINESLLNDKNQLNENNANSKRNQPHWK